MAGPSLFAAADRFRDLIVAQLAVAGRPPLARNFIAEGGVSLDCEQLAIEVELVGVGLPGRPTQAPITRNATWYAQLVAWITRDCATVPDGRNTFPKAAAIEASAQAILADGAVLAESARLLADTCQAVTFLGLTFPGPQGGLTVAHARVQVTP